MAVSRSLAFRALLAIVLMAGYYAFALAISAALLWVPYAEYEYLSRVDFRIAAVCWGAALTILWALVPRPDHFEPPGPQLTPESDPQLFAMIEDVAAATSQQRPSEVYLLNEVNAWVSQRGGFMGFGSRRVMGVGLPLMTNMTTPELRAVIAHEFGHYCSGDVGIGPLIYKTRAAIARTLVGVDQSFLQSVFNWYARVFMRLTMAVSRQQELVADETAARVAGAASVAAAIGVASALAMRSRNSASSVNANPSTPSVAPSARSTRQPGRASPGSLPPAFSTWARPSTLTIVASISGGSPMGRIAWATRSSPGLQYDANETTKPAVLRARSNATGSGKSTE